MKKRLLALTLAILMLFSLLPTMAMADISWEEGMVAALSNGSTTTQYATIAEAATAWNNAPVGNYTITVRAGTYNEGDICIFQLKDRTLTLKADGKVTLSNSETPNGIVFMISGSSSYEGAPVVIDGFDFDLSSTPVTGAVGYAVYLAGGGSGTPDAYYGSVKAYSDMGTHRHGHDVTIQNCSAIGNSAETTKLVECGDTVTGITLYNCTIENVGYLAPSMCNKGKEADETDLIIDSCTVKNAKALLNNQPKAEVKGNQIPKLIIKNTVVDAYHDYTVRVSGGNLTIENCKFNNTYSGNETGAIIVMRNSACNVSISDSSFTSASENMYDLQSKYASTVVANGEINGLTYDKKTVISNTTTTYNFPTPVAKITKADSTEIMYTDLAKAFDDAEDYENCVVDILADVTTSGSTSTSNKAPYCIDKGTYTVNGNGHTITIATTGTNSKGNYIFNVRGNVIFNDLVLRKGTCADTNLFKGAVNVTGDTGPAAAVFNNCDFNAIDEANKWGTAAIIVGSGASVTVNSGSYFGGKADGSDWQGINIGKNTSFLFVDGTTNGIKADDSSAMFSVAGGAHSGSGFTAAAGNTSKGLTGGHYVNDPSDYIADSYTKMASTKEGYAYMVVPAKPAVDPEEIVVPEDTTLDTNYAEDVTPAVGKDVPEEAPVVQEIGKANVEGVADAVSDEAKTELINKALENLNEKVGKGEESLPAGAEIRVEVVIDTDLVINEVEPVNNGDYNKLETIVYDVTPMAKVTTFVGDKQVDSFEERVENTDFVPAKQNFEVTLPCKGMVPLYVIHEEGAKLINVFGSKDFTYNEDEDTVTVTISQFSTLTLASELDPKYDFTVQCIAADGVTVLKTYSNFGDAVAEVDNGQTLKLFKNCNTGTTYPMPIVYFTDKTFVFTLDTNGFEFTGKIIAEPNYTMVSSDVSNNVKTYTFTKNTQEPQDPGTDDPGTPGTPDKPDVPGGTGTGGILGFFAKLIGGWRLSNNIETVSILTVIFNAVQSFLEFLSSAFNK